MMDEELCIMNAMGIPSAEHFCEECYNQAVAHMENEDGTKGAHWSIEEVEEIIRKQKISLGENNTFDFGFCLNMVYSDYFGAVPDNEKTYIELAKKFLFDKDAPQGKALKYYMAMNY